MLEQLTWTPLSKRRENSRLILFYKIINNLAVVPHSCLEKADAWAPAGIFPGGGKPLGGAPKKSVKGGPHIFLDKL